ncbi:hypothetical protein [Marinilabilia salmonicolor]|uniref:hypothetical protein n=1 Tax=Marinilabilia salmonicolor TaxID=989 RepID=UPI000299DB78|nr:hypothetical protein [Marinilabilia salmonicolor]
MGSIKAVEGQSLFDVAIQRLGSAEAAFALATLNGLSITDQPVPGYTLRLSKIIDNDIADFFSFKSLVPTTAGSDPVINEPPVISGSSFLRMPDPDQVKIVEGQSLFDIAIQKLGSAEAALELAVLNGLSLTDELTTGETLQLPGVVNKAVAGYFKGKNIIPATGAAAGDDESGELVKEGIGYWAIGVDFVVS